MDDGTDRPGCTIMRTGQCFSRAIMYRLDREAMVARVVWQFEAPDDVTGLYRSPGDMQTFAQRSTWNEVGGSVYRLANGHYLVAFSSVESDDENPKGAASIFELDAGQQKGDSTLGVDGNRTLATKLDIPTPLSNVGMQNGYRFTPWSSIGGEAAGDRSSDRGAHADGQFSAAPSIFVHLFFLDTQSQSFFDFFQYQVVESAAQPEASSPSASSLHAPHA
ncbi:hypothetical protein JL720_16041 [Aureococcus anophagefferens]|nr:hypothetical protein JL720_16041 [Aureococcus anophagefferens]